MPLAIPVSWGELLDKISILEIKAQHLTDAGKLANVQRELAVLCDVRDREVTPSEELTALTIELRAVNQKIWDLEDDVRDCERKKAFGDEFVQLARQVYHTNDRRAAVKRQINDMLKSDLVEEKSYSAY
jgi:hypothetical protein